MAEGKHRVFPHTHDTNTLQLSDKASDLLYTLAQPESQLPGVRPNLKPPPVRVHTSTARRVVASLALLRATPVPHCCCACTRACPCR